MATTSESQGLTLTYLEENCSGQLLAATTIILIIATLLVALRLYVRVLTPATRGWDEFLLPGAWILVVGASIVCYGMC